jgi:cation-transporting ATPase 13A1
MCHCSILGETVIPQRRKTHGLKIFHRYHFSSALKRMSVIAGHTPVGSTETEYMCAVKGAPETLKSMVLYLTHII